MSHKLKFKLIMIDYNSKNHESFRKILSHYPHDPAGMHLTEIPDSKIPEQINASLEIDSAYSESQGARQIIKAYKAGDPYALVLIDIQMSRGWDAIKTIKVIWESDPDIQIVICSDSSYYAYLKIVNILGLTDRLLILRKPFDYIEVKQLISALLSKWTMTREIKRYAQQMEQIVDEKTTKLSQALLLARATLDSSQEGILMLSPAKEILACNQKFINMWLIPAHLSQKMTLAQLNEHTKQLTSNKEMFNDALLSHSGITPEITLTNGKTYALSVRDYSHNNESMGIIVTTLDISQKKTDTKELSYELTHDYLTGLPNRTLLTDRLTEALISSHHNNRDVGVIHCNVDRFKYINDTLGHGVGDGVLQGITARLRSSIRENDTLYRLGADEFIIVIENVQHKEELLEIAQRIKKDFSFPFCFAEHELKIDCSMGIALSSLTEENPTNLLKCAESALRHAKDSGLGSYCFYIEGMEQENMKQAEIENKLKVALQENEFQLHYQPIVDLRAGKLVGVEALLRWTNSQLGSISPAEFIPIAERSGLIISIGEWIINTVKDQLLEWEKLKIDLFVSMNVSSIQLKNPDFLKKFCQVISENKLNPSQIELELTESILLEQSPHITESLAKLRSLGIRISLDDFGTGYSSLTYLQRFPLNKIKIERSFITNIETQKDSQAIVSAIVAMAHKLELEVVAEGIERPSTVGYLKQMSIDYLQGYYFSPPVVADSITQLILRSKVESLLMAASPTQRPNIPT